MEVKEVNPYYPKFIDSISIRNVAVKIASRYPSDAEGIRQRAFAIYDYVKQNVAYVPDPRGAEYVAQPDVTLDIGGGDCDDQAVLVASLWEAIGLRTRLVRCENTQGDLHLLPQVDFGCVDPHQVSRELRDWYDETFHIGYEVDAEGNYWYPGDTAMCDSFGDISGLNRNDYIGIDENGSDWMWLRLPLHQDKLDLQIQELKFFESPKDLILFEERKYRKVFLGTRHTLYLLGVEFFTQESFKPFQGRIPSLLASGTKRNHSRSKRGKSC